MTNYIRVKAEHSISEGKLNEVKQMAPQFIEKVKANEPGYLSYEWFLSDDESRFYIIGLLKDSDSVLSHFANVGEMIGQLSEIAPATGIELFGDPSDELTKAMAPFGAKVFKHWTGFTR